MRALAALLLVLLSAPADASTIVLDFEEEPDAIHEFSFVSSECGCVELVGVNDRPLIVAEDHLIVGEEGGSLLMNFLLPVLGVSLEFGNDSPAPDVEIGDARLGGFVGDTEVVTAFVSPNRNNLVDQTISIAWSEPLTSVLFALPQSDFYEPISPVVDNIVLTTVPEPGTLGLLALVLAGVATRPRLRLRRR